MVQRRKHAVIRKIKDITISSTLSLSLLGGMGMMGGCGSENNNRDEYEVVFTKGMETHIAETEKGVFKITDERVVGERESKAIVTFLNGGVDTLSIEQAKRIVDAQQADSTALNANNQDQVRHNGHYYGGGLGNALLYGSLGYMLGRNMNSRPNPGFYANPDVYTRAQQHTTTVQNSRVARPTNASRGYFKGGTGGSRSVGA